MNIFVYSDESGVFDQLHNDIFVFGGLIFLSKEDKDIWCRKYSSFEKPLYLSGKAKVGSEIKAAKISNSDKNKLYRSLNPCHKFGVVIDQKKILKRIFASKKDKQRYLDYAYKIGIKRAFQQMINREIIIPDEVEHIYFFADEHTTATNGKYELREALEQELKNGTYNQEWDNFYPPIFPKVQGIELKFCNSSSTTLVRAADIIANKILYIATNDKFFLNEISNRNMYITHLP